MSDIRKAIMARLGEFALPGAKAAMGIEKSTDVKNIGNVDQDGYSYGADRVIGRDGDVRFRSYFVDKSKGIGNREISPLFASAEQAKSWIKNKLDKWTRTHLFPKRNASRPGEKEKMANTSSQEVRSRLLQLQGEISNLETKLRSAAKAGDFRLCHGICRVLTATYEKLGAAYLQWDAASKPTTASRPGAKAKMGRMLQSYEVDELEEFLDAYGVKDYDIITSIGQVKVPKSQVGKALDAISSLNREIRKEGIGGSVAVDVVPFSRPGAKAKMARWEESHAEGWGDLSKTLTATINGTRWTIVVDASTGKGQLMRSTGRGPQVVKEGAVDQLKRYAETARASRLGAKSTNALSDACWQGYEAVGTKKQDGKTVPNCVPKATAAKPESQDIESEEVKAGLKLMEKADEKVSEKIRTLIKEGKPQDQAVAIALDMKRRGEL